MKKITLFLFVLFSCWQINAQSIVIGTATTTTTSTGNDPIDGYYESFRYQVVYTAAELSASMTPYDEITALGFSIAGDYGGGNLLGYTIKMGHTSASNCAAHINSSTIVVKNPFNYNPTVTAAGVFDMITFDTNFVWNGVDNVLVEICSDGPNPYTSPYGQVRANTSVTNGSRFVRADGATSCGVTTTTTNGNKPNIQFSYIEGTPPSCLPPNALAANSITNSSAVLGWNENGTATVWNIQYGITGFALGSGIIVPGVTNTYSLPGLTSNTQYQYYVQADCGGTQSTWSGPFSFRTLCDALPVPFNESFDSTSTTEACWAVLNVNADADTWNLNDTSAPISGNQSAIINTDFNNGANDDWLISPKITLNGNQRLVFKNKVISATEPNDFRVMLSTTGASPSDFTTTLMPLTSFSNTNTETRIIPLTGITGNVFIAWHVPAGGLDGWILYIDDVVVEDIPSTPPTCTTILSPTSGAINVPNPTVTWAANIDATGYNISVGTTPGGTDVLNNFNVGNVLSYTIPNLEGGSTYYVTIYPYNVNGQATGCTEINFSTCDIATIPFNEEFESITTGVPSCWGIASTPTNSGYNFSSFATGNTGRGLRFDSYLNANGNTGELTTPVIDASSVSTLRLKFYYKNPTGGNFEVYVSTNGGSTYTLLESGLTGAANWTLKSYVLTSYIGANLKIKFKGISNYGSGDAYIYLDGVVLEEIPVTLPSCVAITSPANGAINVSNSTVTWLANVDATGYRISVGTTPGATDVLNNFDVGNVLSYYLSNLVGGSTYYVSVFPYNPYGQAVGCTEINFTTCDELGDFFENFDTLTATGQIPSCWSKILSNGVSTFATVGSSTTNFSAPYSISLYNSDSPATANIMLVTPYINNLSAGTNRLRFVASNSVASQDVIVGTMSNPSDANTFTPLQTVDINGTFTQYIVDFTAYAGTDKYIAIKRLSTSTYSYVYIDNVIWEAVPSSAPACATNVVATPHPTCGNFATTITWNASSGADGYYISIGTTPAGTDIANNLNLGNVLTYSFTGNAGSTYYYTIYPFNAIGTAVGCAEASFATNVNGCFCIPTYTNGGTGDNITNVVIGSWSNASTGNVSPYYEDFTLQQPAPIAIPTMTAGLNSTVAVTMGTDGTQYSRVWIDFNQNLTFEPSESFSLGTSAGGSGTSNIIVNVPAGATLGVTRMRIRGGDDADILNTQACGASSSTYGQTEDYLVNILPAPSCLPPTALNATAVTSSSANLGWTEVGTATMWDVEWGTFGFTPTGTPTITNATNTQPISSLSPNTTYSFYVRANCGAGGYSTWSGPFSFTTSCVADNVPYTQNFESATVPALPSCTTQQNVGTGNLWTVQNNGGYGFTTNALRYSWNSSSDANVWFYTNGINLVGGTTYKITYDYGGTGTTFPEKLKVSYGNSANAAAMTTLLADHPNVVNDTPVSNLVNFTPATSGVYYFGFNAYSIADQFYLFVDNIVVDVALSNANFDNSNFIAYPNPVRDILNISYTTEISSVRVINMIGQEVISKNINATSTQVDMSALSAGAYIVNVTVGDSVKTLKVVKQ